ncbi:hypothetical protein [Alistipes senegalensis]|uniref:DNA mismatch repair protein MutS-like N-terminal domain-containing protein n=1 Tax=Alistipes senegalensis JC50 TaxID=1033732 RepID=A0ABY5V8F1_9BACT|nr:hypothetical protein [Alistipes senegalensis]UEA86476.1 hypothetical protein LK406_12355 [Alistipes senegalensis]UWN65935.1 hypothetical protein NQ519_03590 [Alistipes senegalensis JC50]
MTSQDFIRTEAANTDRIILYREGLFWKAYERSAFAVCSQVRAFKTTKKALKTLGGGHLVSIGFPAASENAVCGALECISREQDRVVFAAPRAVDAAEFEVWKAAQPLKEAVRRTKTAAAAVDAGAAAAAADAGAGFGGAAGVAGGAAGVAGGAVADVAATGAVAAGPGFVSGSGFAAGPGFAAGLGIAVAGNSAASGPLPEFVSGPGIAVAGNPAASGPLPEERMRSPSEAESRPGMRYAEADFSLTAACRVAGALKEFNLAEKTPLECMMFLSELKKMIHSI